MSHSAKRKAKATVLKVLSAFNPSVKGKHIDLARTYTNDFVNAK